MINMYIIIQYMYIRNHVRNYAGFSPKNGGAAFCRSTLCYYYTLIDVAQRMLAKTPLMSRKMLLYVHVRTYMYYLLTYHCMYACLSV